MNSSKIIVNGALMDNNFFDDNVSEAKTYFWVEKSMATITGHAHCIVCTIALPNSQSEKVFASENVLLCDHCYMNYVK